MSKYDHGKIYKLTNDMNGDTYIGSTTDPITKRLKGHIGYVRHRLTDERKLYSVMREVGEHHFKIELIEEYPCSSRKELLLREEYYINQLKPTLNSRTKLVDTRTSQELNRDRYIGRRDQQLEYCRIRYRENAEKIKAHVRAYAEQNREVIAERSKKYREAHKDELRAKKSQVVECPCGGRTTASHHGRHKKCKQHQEWLRTQEEEST